MTLKLTRQYVDALDVIVVQSPNFPQPRVKGIFYNGKCYEGNDLASFVVFGAVLARNNRTGRYPSPLLSFGPPREEIFEGNKRYVGLVGAGKISEDGYLPLEERSDGCVTVWKSGPSVYAGSGNDIDALLFSEPLPFDAEKELLFARSPNGMVLLDSLGTEKFQETLIPVWYELVKENGCVQRYDETLENLDFLDEKDRQKKVVRKVMVEDNEGKMTLYIHEGRNRRQYNISLEDAMHLDFEALSIATCPLPKIPEKKQANEEQKSYDYSLVYANPQNIVANRAHIIRNEGANIYWYMI